MSRLDKIKEFTHNLLHKKKDKKSGKTVVNKATVGDEKLNVSGTTCYVVQGDLLLIGTRAELESKVKGKVGILELESETKAKLEATAKIVNETFTKTAEATAAFEAKNKSSAKLGKHVQADLELEAKAAATATAIVDLTKLMVELGVEVNANMKIQGSVSLDLKIVDVKAFMSAEIIGKASAKVSASWKGVEAEAKASAEAKATMGAEVASKPFKIGKTDIKIILKPSITAYARAEAKAAAAVGLKTGVSVGATAAIGLRGTIEAVLNGNYTIKEGLDQLNRIVDPKTGKSTAAPDVSDKDLGTAGLEVSLELSVGAEFSATPINFSVVKENGFDYAVGQGNISVNIPGLMSGPAGVGVGINIYVKILNEIVKDVIKELKEEIKRFIVDVVGKILVEQFEKFKKEVAILAEKLTDLGVDAITSILEFIGKDLTAIDLKIKYLDNRLFAINADYMKNITIHNSDPSNAENNKALEENKAKLEKEFEQYNLYVEKAFGEQEAKIARIISKAGEKVAEIKSKKGEKSSEEAKAFKKAASITKDTAKRMKELINTKKGIIVYVGPNRKVLNLKPSILEKTQQHVEEMENTLQLLEEFAGTVA